MTTLHDLSDLDPADAATADAVRRAFAHVTLDRPAPTTVAPVAALHDALAGGGGRRPRRTALVGVAAATFAFVAGGTVLLDGSGGAGVAWAATPDAVGDADLAEATDRCGEVLDPSATGTRETVDRSAGREGVPAPAAPDLPDTLPPLQVLDRRGDGAYAVFADDTWTAECFLVRRGDGWERTMLTVSDTAPPASPTAIEFLATGSTAFPDGTTASVVTGVGPAAAARVVLTLADGTEVEASRAGVRFAFWFPSALPSEAATVRAFDASGAELDTAQLPDPTRATDAEGRGR